MFGFLLLEVMGMIVFCSHTGRVVGRRSYHWHYYRSSCPEVLCEKDVPKNFFEFTGKHLRWSYGLSFIKKRLHHRCFRVNFAKFLRAPFLQNTSGRLLLLLSIFLSLGADVFLAIIFTVGVAKSFVIAVSFGRGVGLIADLYTEFSPVSTPSSRATNASFRLFVSLGLLSPRKPSCKCMYYLYMYRCICIYIYNIQISIYMYIKIQRYNINRFR